MIYSIKYTLLSHYDPTSWFLPIIYTFICARKTAVPRLQKSDVMDRAQVMDSLGSSSSSFRWRRVLDEEWDPDGREKRQNDRSRRLAYLKNIHMGYYTYTGFKKKTY